MTNKTTDDIAVKIEILKKLIEIDMISSATSGKVLKKKSAIMKWIVIGISCLITIILGLNLGGSWGSIGNNIALFFSALLTAANSWDAFVKYESRSLQEYSNSSRLNILYKDILMYEAGNNNLLMDRFNDFEARYRIIQEEYIEERKASSEKSDSKEASPPTA